MPARTQDVGVSYVRGSRKRVTIWHMIVPTKQPNLVRISLTLDPVDVDLLDRLGKLEGRNRSQEMRGILEQLRPVLSATVDAFEAALAQRDKFDAVAATAAIQGLEELLPEVEKMARDYMGAMSRIEGAAAVAAAENDDDAPASNTGATK